MSDIVERLRDPMHDKETWIGPELREAADEIERLREMLRRQAERIEKIAFEMAPPNTFTPRFIQLANECRAIVAVPVMSPDRGSSK